MEGNARETTAHRSYGKAPASGGNSVKIGVPSIIDPEVDGVRGKAQKGGAPRLAGHAVARCGRAEAGHTDTDSVILPCDKRPESVPFAGVCAGGDKRCNEAKRRSILAGEIDVESRVPLAE